REHVAAATSAGDMPTREWTAATGSGIDVIGTRRAITAPMLPPMAMPRTTSSQPIPSAGGCAASVVATAIAMPIIPKKLPCRDEAGLDSPRSDRMNRTPATRYSTAARLAFMTYPVMRGLDPRIHLKKGILQKAMACRVKPGNDETSFAT